MVFGTRSNHTARLILGLSLLVAACSSSAEPTSTPAPAGTDDVAEAPDLATSDQPSPSSTAEVLPEQVPDGDNEVAVELPFDEIDEMARALERRSGDVDVTTEVDGSVGVVSMVLTTTHGTVSRRIVTFADGIETTITITDPGGSFEGSESFRTVSGDDPQPFVDGGGFPRNADRQLSGEPNRLAMPTRAVRQLDEWGTALAPLPFPTESFAELSPNEFNLYSQPSKWEVELGGVIEVAPLPTTTAAGTCYLLFGSVTPINRPPQFLAEAYRAPTVMLVIDEQGTVANGLSFLSPPLQCEVLDAFALGYTQIEQGSVANDTTSPFYATWFVPEGRAATTFTVGDSGQIAYFNFDVADSIPPADPPQPTNVRIEAAELGATTSFSHYAADWDVTIDAVDETGHNSPFYGSEFTNCFVVVGELTRRSSGDSALDIDDDSVGLVGSGLFRESDNGLDSADCDVSAAVAAGYQELGRADFALDEAVRFYTPVYFEKRLVPEFVAVGIEFDRVFFEIDPGARQPESDTTEALEELAPGITRIVEGDDWCTVVDKLQQNYGVIGPLPHGDRDLVRRSFTQTLDGVQVAATRAPGAIANEMVEVAARWESLVELHRDVGWILIDVDFDAIADIGKRSSVAAIAVQEYNEATCG